MQLFVPGGWWKASEIPDEDLKGSDKERIGCLISEVVVPGWQPEQHIFLDQEKVSNRVNKSNNSWTRWVWKAMKSIYILHRCTFLHTQPLVYLFLRNIVQSA